MKVKELIEKLQECDPELEVVVSGAHDMNTPCCGVGYGEYYPESKFYGYFYSIGDEGVDEDAIAAIKIFGVE